MFDYVKEVFEKEMDELEEKMSQGFNKQQGLFEKSKHINSYFNILDKQKSNKKNIIICVLTAIACGIFGFMNISSTVYFLWIIATFGFTFGAALNVHNLHANKYKIQKEYSDLSSLSIQELIDEIESVLKKIDIEDNNIKYISNRMTEINSYLEKIQFYIESDEYLSYSIDNQKDVEVYLQLQQDNLLEKFLEEKVDYSMIHFDNSIGEEIEYKEAPKQFIKKI